MKLNTSNLGRLMCLIILFGIELAGCSSDGGSKSMDSANRQATITVNMKADFLTSSLAKPARPFELKGLVKIATCPAPQPAWDQPGYEAGLDCDNDGGVIQYITPTNYNVAFKRLTFIKDDGTEADIIADTGTLASSVVLDITSQVTIASPTLSSGDYTSIEAEIYYYELEMSINDPPVTQAIRVYLSDDDFAGEGHLGHHQGDITLIAANGTELGWVDGGAKWEPAALVSPRGSVNGAGGTDSETGHLRGLYGDTSLWNQTAFVQGSTQDIYLATWPLNITVEDTDQTVVFSFRVGDSWFYEDFDNNQQFNPCAGVSDACAGGAEWSPLFPAVSISVF
jgi:hypothetical protein